MANKNDFIASGPGNPDLPKSHFDLSYTNNLTANFGKIYPVGCWQMPAGSRFDMSADFGFDLQPLVFPVQTNMRFHMKTYKVPLRILQKNWRNYVSKGGTGYEMPFISRSEMWHGTGSLADYMGVPSFQTTDRQSKRSSSLSIFGLVNSVDINSTTHGFGQIYSFYNERNNARPTLDTSVRFVSAFRLPLNNGEYLDKVSIRATYTTSSSLSMAGTYFGVCRRLDYAYTDIVSLETRDLSFFTVQDSLRIFEDISSHITRSGHDIIIDNVRDLFPSLGTAETFDDLYFCVISPFSTSSTNSVVYVTNNASQTLSVTIQGNGGAVENDKYEASGTLLTPYSITMSRGFITATYSITSYIADEAASSPFVHNEGDKAPRLPILAYRFRAYEFIFNYFFRNERVTPFMKDKDGVLVEAFNEYLTNDGDGADTTTPLDFKYAPYEYDLFTTCVKSPTFGDAPLIGVSFNYTQSGDTPQGEFTFIKDGVDTYEKIGVSLDRSGAITGITNYDGDASNPNIHNLQQLIEFGISVNDIRNVSAYQRYKERLVKAGPKYVNYMQEFFGTNPPIGEEFPEYIGGYTDNIQTSKILNTSASNPDVKLGEYAGNAYLRGKSGRKISCYCQEDCIIMAVGWFSVTPTYSQKLDKDLVYTSLLDFVNPAFASVSPQPVYKYQIAPLELDNDHLFDVFGYNRPFAEAVSKQDEVHGDFRSNMSGYVFQRIFHGSPSLNEDFLYIKPEDLTQIFSVTDTSDKIFGQIAFKVNASLPLPHMSVPHIV